MACYTIVHYNVISLFILFERPPMTMDAILATVVNGEGAIIVIIIEASEKIDFCLIYNFILNPSKAALPNPFHRSSRECGMFVHQNHDNAAGRGKRLNHGEDLCVCEFC